MSAEHARVALLSHRFTEAKEIITSALQVDPSNPDLLCESLICDCYYGHEREAAERFDALLKLNSNQTAKRIDDLELLLSRYFYCCSELAKKRGTRDIQSDDWLSKHPYKGEPGVGITIAATLIVKNEGSILTKCLESLRDIVDEIVIVDTGSTDNTIEIAKQFGAKVGFFEWCNDFSAARNYALSLSNSNWNLWIDADEQLDADCKRRFEDAIVRPHLGGYSIQIVNFLDEGGTTVEFVHTPTRLFRNIPGVRFTEPIHEQITPSLQALGLPWTYLEGAKIYHDGYRTASMEEKNKVERTKTLLHEVIDREPNNPFHLFNLANTYFVERDFENSEYYAARAVANLAPEGAEYGTACYQVWAVSLDSLRRHEEALKVCEQCDRTPYKGLVNDYLKATCYLNLGRPEEAYMAIRDCLDKEWPSDLVGDKGIADFRRHGLHAQILGALDRWEESLEAFEDVLARQPGFPASYMGRAIAHENLGHLELAKADYQQAMQEPGLEATCLRGLAVIAEKQSDWQSAAEYYRNALEMVPFGSDFWNGWVDALTQLGDAQPAYDYLGEMSYKQLMEWAAIFADRPELAIRCLEAAIRKNPEEPNTYFLCGDLLYKYGAFSDAVMVYESGIRLNMQFPEGWFVLGNSLAQLGADEAAIKCYETVLQLEPNHFGAKQNLDTVRAA